MGSFQDEQIEKGKEKALQDLAMDIWGRHATQETIDTLELDARDATIELNGVKWSLIEPVFKAYCGWWLLIGGKPYLGYYDIVTHQWMAIINEIPTVAINIYGWIKIDTPTKDTKESNISMDDYYNANEVEKMTDGVF